MPDDPQFCADCGEEIPACLCETEANPNLCQKCGEQPHGRTTGPDHPMYADTWYWCNDCQDTARERQDERDFHSYHGGSMSAADYAQNHAQQQAKENK